MKDKNDSRGIKKPLKDTQKEIERKFMQTVDEKMKALELADSFYYTGMISLPSYGYGVYPEKFKIPQFEKCDGTGCPILQVRLYVRKIAKYT